MRENGNGHMPQELNEDQLNQVVGGAYDSSFLDEGIPRHWAVTCTNCGLQFFVNTNADCPSCANTEVYLTYDDKKPIFDSNKHGWN